MDVSYKCVFNGLQRQLIPPVSPQRDPEDLETTNLWLDGRTTTKVNNIFIHQSSTSLRIIRVMREDTSRLHSVKRVKEN